MPKNKNHHKAKKERCALYSTHRHSKRNDAHHFLNETIYRNENFHTLKLKKLIATSYNPNGQGTYLEYDGETLLIQNLIENGNFQSQECHNLLQEANIIVTNPPFSLFEEFVQQVQNANKEFLIIGTNYTLHGTEARIDEWGKRIVSSNNTCWFTNLTHSKRNQILTLTKTYNPNQFQIIQFRKGNDNKDLKVNGKCPLFQNYHKTPLKSPINNEIPKIIKIYP